VLEALEKGSYSLGGEQSGHVVFRDLATTGDGLLTGVQLLDLVVRSGRPLSSLASDAMTRLPQVLVNVRVSTRHPDVVGAIGPEIAAVEASLGRHGRVLVRPSGTEPLVRVMVEAEDAEQAEEAANTLSAAVREACEA
jgi:phosphoglucosamine mutase